MTKTALIGVTILALGGTLHAQESSDRDSETELEEIVVFAERARTATKTDTALTDIPQSISVLTAEQIAERGALNYQDVFRYAAGVDAERFGADTRSDDLSARGFPVVQYLDGLNKMPDFVYGIRTEVFTLERAEILRGPSAVLYGAGSAGGLVNAVSKRPEFDFGGELGVQLGSNERRQLQVDVTGGLDGAERFAGRFVGVVRDGELQSEGQANDKVVAMPSVTWRPTADTEATVLVLYQEEDLGTQTYLPLSKTLNASGPEKLAVDFFVGEPDFNRMKNDHLSGTLILEHRVNDRIGLASRSRYYDHTVDYAEVYGSYYGGTSPFVDAEETLLAREFYVLDDAYEVLNSDNQMTLEFDTGLLAHKVLVGIDYTRFEQDRREGFSCRGVTDGSFGCYTGGSPPPLDIYAPQYGQSFDIGFTNAFTTESTQLGFYVQDQIDYGERVSVVVGARRDRATSASNGGDDDVNKATTFRGGFIVETVAGISPYISYSESFQPVFGGDFFGVPFEPREGRQYEAGVKWQPAPNTLVTALWFDVEETNFVTADPDNIQNFIQAGAVGSEGYELEAILNLDGGLSLTASYSHTEATVLQGTLDHPAGDRIEDLPEDLASLWVSQIFDVGSGWAARVSAGARYVGDKIDYYQLQRTPSVTLVDASAEFNYEDWDFSVNVNNLLDKEFYAHCAAWSSPYGVCHPGLSRRVIATVGRRFQ